MLQATAPRITASHAKPRVFTMAAPLDGVVLDAGVLLVDAEGCVAAWKRPP